MWIVLIVGLLLLLLVVPQFWVRNVIRRYSAPRDDIPGTGGQLARHLLDRFGLQQVGVESTDQGDHYDPRDRVVRLSAEHYNGRSLAAVTIAAHEVGHALQDAQGMGALRLRTRLVELAGAAQKTGVLSMVAVPLMAVVSRSATAAGIILLLAVLGFATGFLVHLVTLPVELDASFRRALPILRHGRYIADDDGPAARRILQAAALTYVAASVTSMLSIWRWIAILRR